MSPRRPRKQNFGFFLNYLLWNLLDRISATDRAEKEGGDGIIVDRSSHLLSSGVSKESPELTHHYGFHHYGFSLHINHMNRACFLIHIYGMFLNLHLSGTRRYKTININVCTVVFAPTRKNTSGLARARKHSPPASPPSLLA